MMGTLLMEHGRQAGVEKFVAVGTICAYPKLTRVQFREATARFPDAAALLDAEHPPLIVC